MNTQQKEGGGEMSRWLNGRKTDGQGGARERENGEEEEAREEESEGTTGTSEEDVIEAPHVRLHRLREALDVIRDNKQQKVNESRENQGQKKTPTNPKKKSEKEAKSSSSSGSEAEAKAGTRKRRLLRGSSDECDTEGLWEDGSLDDAEPVSRVAGTGGRTDGEACDKDGGEGCDKSRQHHEGGGVQTGSETAAQHRDQPNRGSLGLGGRAEGVGTFWGSGNLQEGAGTSGDTRAGMGERGAVESGLEWEQGNRMHTGTAQSAPENGQGGEGTQTAYRDGCGHVYNKPTHIWTNLYEWTPQGQTGTGKCECRCNAGRVGPKGKWRHRYKIAGDSSLQGRGKAAMKNMVPQQLQQEIWASWRD